MEYQCYWHFQTTIFIFIYFSQQTNKSLTNTFLDITKLLQVYQKQ